MPDAHQRQRPQPGRNDVTMWSPTSKPGVYGPTAATMPAPSCPPANGRMPGGRSPVAKWSSEWQRPAATISSITSPWRGSSKSMSTISHFPGVSLSTAPLVLILRPPVARLRRGTYFTRARLRVGLLGAGFGRGCVAHGVLCALDGAAYDVFDVVDVESECLADV